MWGKPKTLVLAAAVGAAALVPLFGDPRATPVTHPLWARLLLRALDMTEAVRASTQASQVFAVLSWRDSLSLPADRFTRSDAVSVREHAGRRLVSAGAVPGELTYTLAVAQPGDYRMRVRIAGPPERPAALEVTRIAGGAPLAAFALQPAQELAWVFGGALHLDPGAYAAQLLLPPGSAVAHLEVAPPCLNPIEPPGGWTATGVTTAEDLAVTALRALDAEPELAPAALPIEIAVEEFALEAQAEPASRLDGHLGFAGSALAAGTRGLRASVSFDVPDPGLYSLSAFGAPGGGQRWLLDGCRKAVVCPGGGAGWRAVLSQPLAAGRHLLVLALGPGAVVERVRIEQKRHASADYVSALKRLGFDPGPPGPVVRATALDAGRFVRDRRRSRVAELCGDRVEVEDAPAALTARAAPPAPAEVEATQPAPPVVGPPAEPPEPPVGPPLLPPQPPASPTRIGAP